MGVVYKAQDLKLDRAVALKFLPPELTLDPEAKGRFIHEAKAASALDHNNICNVHEIAETDDGQIFIVMAHYEGETLKSRIAKGPLKIEEATDLAIQIAQGLAEAHAHGIVHRDVKPANILITKSGVAKIVDFGLAKLSASTKLTKTGSTLGTLAYMSPEQLQGSDVDARADIFSLGVVLYEMLAGKTPFRGDHEAALMYSIVNEQPVEIHKYVTEIPDEMVHILNRALEKETGKRYQTVGEMFVDLHALKREDKNEKVTSYPKRKMFGLSLPGGGTSAKRLIGFGFVGATVVAVALGIYIVVRSGGQSRSIVIGRTTQVTSEPGMEIDPALSPDGKMIAYTAEVNGKLRILVKQMGGGRSIPLTERLPGVQRCPQWSPDGTQIAFLSYEGSKRIIYIMPCLGGVPKKITEDTRNDEPYGLYGASWSPDGKRLAYARRGVVYEQEVGAGEPRKIIQPFEPHSFSWSPQGTLIAFVSGNPGFVYTPVWLANISPSSVWIVSHSDGTPVQITDNTSLNMSPVWMSDSRRLLFVSDRGGSRDVYDVSLDVSGRPEGPVERLTNGLNAYTISLSGDASQLAYSVLTNSANIWSIRIPDKGTISVSEATAVTTGNQAIEGLCVSRDGKWLVYDSNRSGNQDVYRMPLTSGEPEQLTTDPRDDFQPSLSPDGKSIAFYSFRAGNRDLFVMSSDGSGQQPVTRDPAQERYPDWSPDGRHLVFHSNKEGRDEIYVVSRAQGDAAWEVPRRLSFDGGRFPRWSPDGELIAYIGENCLRVIPPAGGNARVLVATANPDSLPAPWFPAWSSDGRTLYYKAYNTTRESSIWAVPVSGGATKMLVKFDDPSRQLSRLEFTTDGRRFFFTISKFESDIFVMELLKQK
jgi:Tol biopolymer transport system component